MQVGGNYEISTGIVRRLDELGRVVIPKEMRKVLELKERDPMEIEIEGTEIILRKYENRCAFCGKVRPEHNFKQKKICKTCLEELCNKLKI